MDDTTQQIFHGPQTALAVANFPVSGRPMPTPIIGALALVKIAAARANGAIDGTPVTEEMAEVIETVAAEIADGRWDDQFPVDVFQTGSGTSTNMNMNEVIAGLARERRPDLELHPNDHVNASQSTNDTVPTAIRIACLLVTRDRLLPALELLEGELRTQARATANVVKAGRTHLMDASPIMLGDEFDGWADQIASSRERLRDTSRRVRALPLGGTATGNGLNAPDGYSGRAIAELATLTGLDLVETAQPFAAQGSQDDLVELSGQLRATAVALCKIADDLRWLGSGPKTGLRELRLPDLQPGSSIMPGKVNPVICEVVTQVVARVIGNDATVAFAGTQGRFELNAFLPVMALALTESIGILSSSTTLLATKCVAGLAADVDVCRRYAESTPAIATALNRRLGYDVATRVVHDAEVAGTTIRSTVVEQGLLSEEEVDAILDPEAIARTRR